MPDPSLVPTERIERAILMLRGHKVMLDSDLAALYGVKTKVLNQAVKRNTERFPPDFLFRLTLQEVADLRSQSVTSSGEGEWVRNSTAEGLEGNRSPSVTGSQKHRDPRFRPYAFTEHGALMAANVLRSPRAVKMSVFVVRAFVRLRRMVASNAELARRLDELEKKHDAQFEVVFDAIRALMATPRPQRRPIGFRVEEAGAGYRILRRRARSR